MVRGDPDFPFWFGILCEPDPVILKEGLRIR